MAGEVEGWRGVGGACASSRGVGKTKFRNQNKDHITNGCTDRKGLFFALLAMLRKTEILTFKLRHTNKRTIKFSSYCMFRFFDYYPRSFPA